MSWESESATRTSASGWRAQTFAKLHGASAVTFSWVCHACVTTRVSNYVYVQTFFGRSSQFGFLVQSDLFLCPSLHAANKVKVLTGFCVQLAHTRGQYKYFFLYQWTSFTITTAALPVWHWCNIHTVLQFNWVYSPDSWIHQTFTTIDNILQPILLLLPTCTTADVLLTYACEVNQRL